MIVSTLGNLSAALPPATSLLLAARRVSGPEAGGPLAVSLAVALIAIAAVCGGLYVAHRWWDRYRHQSHAALFRGLCDAQGLDAPTRRLLAQVGRHHRLGQLARLFTEPQWLDPARLSGPLKARAQELSVLRARLFSIDAPKA